MKHDPSDLARKCARALRSRSRAIIAAAFCSTAALAAPDSQVAALDDRQNADRLLVVDCLLPGQVRQLGTGVTYLAPRRGIKTTGSDCAIRGGEYVANDRANYTTALKVWLPQAEAGDKVAQVYVGEIYERGLGTAPDYAQASVWYKKAADQNYTRAYISLGFLYEQGLGVPKDPAMALNYYRKAAGIQGSINLDGAPSPASKEELDALRKELDRARQDLEKARRELDQERLKSSQEIERLLKRKLEAAAAGNTEETRRLEAQLKERETELEKRRQQVARFEQANEDYKARLARLEGESASLRKDLELAQRQLALSQREVEDKKAAAAEAERRVAAMQQDLARQKSAASPPDPGRIKALEAELEKNRAEFARQKQEITRLEGNVSGYKDAVAKLDRLEGESASLRKELGDAQRRLAQTQREVEDKKAAAAEAERRVAAMQQELARQKSASAPADPGRIKALEAELEKSRAEFARQKQEVTRLEADVTGYKARVAKLEATPEPAKQDVSISPPSIQIIDPQVVITRDTATVTVRSGIASRQVVGRVTAPAGLLSFTANDVPQEVDADGYFKTSVDLRGGKTRMTLVAIDRQGKRAPLEFFLEPERTSGPAPAAPISPVSRKALGLGNNYALVIGNQNYQKLGSLNTPKIDAIEIAALLTDRYDFKVTVLFDATRWEILEELNKLRAVVTEKDSFLLYYAGHGQLDTVNYLANWLPVDADPNSTANWIASSTLTENLNQIAAKHILVVADSCYSGAMTRSSIGQLQPGMSEEARREWLQSIASKKSRTVLTSGGVAPVMDGGGGKHSIFAQSFIDALRENTDAMLGAKLGEVVSARVQYVSRRLKFDQQPLYNAIKFTDHDLGDFIFVPKET